MGGLPFHIVFSKKGRKHGVTGAFDGKQNELLDRCFGYYGQEKRNQKRYVKHACVKQGVLGFMCLAHPSKVDR